MENLSIFKRMEEIIRREGCLPADFQPEEKENQEGKISFAPGALEGIINHHSGGNGEKSDFINTLKQYVLMAPGTALEKFEKEKADTFQTATIRKSLLNDIMKNQKQLNAGKVASLAYVFAANGRKCETVKLGLSMMMLFNFSENPQVCHLFKTLGYCEEFTDYVLMNIGDWEESKQQELLFELAQKLHGWGKINTVEQLEADTEEKKHWILCHGCKNSVLNAYLGRICAEKGDLYGRLQKGNLTEEELLGAGEIMEGLLDEGPCAGMSALEQPVELTLLYLKAVEEALKGTGEGVTEDAIAYAAGLSSIYEYFQEKEWENAGKVCDRVKEIMDALDVDSIIAAGMKEHTWECLQVAKIYNKDVSTELLQLMREDLQKYFNFSYYLFRDNYGVDEFLALCEEKVEGVTYPRGMGNLLMLKLEEGLLHLDMVVQYLDKYPLKGRKLVEICMNSPSIRWRNMAVKAMLGWTKKLNQSLKEIDEDLYAKALAVSITEINKGTKEEWSKLV